MAHKRDKRYTSEPIDERGFKDLYLYPYQA